MIRRHLRQLLILSFSAIWMASTSAQAAELLVKFIHPGYVPNGFNNVVYRTAIMSDGQVVKGYKIEPSSPWRESAVAHLDNATLASLNAKLSQLEAGNLNFPAAPGYADGPTISYAGHTNHGEVVSFYQFSFGLWGKLEAYLYAEDLKNLLDSF